MQNIFFVYAVKIQQENVTDSKMKHSLISSPYILYFNPKKQLYPHPNVVAQNYAFAIVPF